MAKVLEAVRVMYGYPIDESEGTLEEIRIWAHEILTQKGGYIEICDPETGGYVETIIRAEIFDAEGFLNETIIGEFKETRDAMLEAIHHKEGWIGKYVTHGERGSKEIIRMAGGVFITAILSGTDIADWATRKWNKDALYMLEETHECTNVYGPKLRDAGVEVLKGRGFR